MEYITCANPLCQRVFHVKPGSHESNLLESLRDVSKVQCCQDSGIQYFCPSADEVADRQKRVLALLDTTSDRAKAVVNMSTKLKGSTTGCYQKAREFKEQVILAQQLIHEREIFSKYNTVISELDFPEELRVESAGISPIAFKYANFEH
jgi:hypothetical protein